MKGFSPQTKHSKPPKLARRPELAEGFSRHVNSRVASKNQETAPRKPAGPGTMTPTPSATRTLVIASVITAPLDPESELPDGFFS